MFLVRVKGKEPILVLQKHIPLHINFCTKFWTLSTDSLY